MTNYCFTKDELYHHGILGQKWGIRRFQNKDGSYTTAGKERRKETNSKNSKVKKVIKIGLALGGTALAAYGGYKLYKNIPSYYKKLGKKNVNFIRNSGKFDYLNVSLPAQKKAISDGEKILNSALRSNNLSTNKIKYDDKTFNQYNNLLLRLESQLMADPSNAELRKRINEVSAKIFD